MVRGGDFSCLNKVEGHCRATVIQRDAFFFLVLCNDYFVCYSMLDHVRSSRCIDLFLKMNKI